MELKYKTYTVVTEHEVVEKYERDYVVEAQSEEEAKEIIANKYHEDFDYDKARGSMYSISGEKTTNIKINIKK